MLSKLLVDDGESAFHSAVGLLDTDVEGVGGDSGAIGESHHTPINIDAATHHVQRVPMREDRFYHAPLGCDCRVFILFFSPDFGQSTAFIEEFGRELTLFEVGMLGTKTVDVVSLGIEPPAAKRGEDVTMINVVVLVA